MEEYEKVGFKDTVFLDENETVRVVARFLPYGAGGEYMFHCHNLVHEDHDMMAVFNVEGTKEGERNRDEFSDPMNPRFRASVYSGTTDLEDIREGLLRDVSGWGVYDGERNEGLRR